MRTLGGVVSALRLAAPRLAAPRLAAPRLAAVLLAAVLLAASVWLGTPAARADIGPDQAKALTAQLRDWLRGMVGPTADLPDLRTTAEGDHYLLRVPIAELGGPDKDIIAHLRPLDGGQWAADGIRLPADTTLTTTVPPGKDRPVPMDVHLHLTIADQDSHGEFDPAMAAASTLVIGLRGITLDSQSGAKLQRQNFDSYSQTLTLRPAAAGKLDIDETGTAEGWKSAQAVSNRGAMAVGAKRLSGNIHIVGLDRTQATTLGPVLCALASAPSPDGNERLRALVMALHGLFTSIKFDETIEGMQVAIAGQGNAVIDRVRVGFDSATPDGVVASNVSLGLDGLAMPGLSVTSANLAPKHVKLGVSLEGVSAEALNNLALAALLPNSTEATLAPQIDALFTDPGKTGAPRVGIETLGFDIGPAQVEGHGSVVAISQTDVRGTARITVTGFDALTDRMREDPELQQMLPFLILARGMARSEGSALVWDIVFTPTGLTVNGVDPRTLLMQPRQKRQKQP